MFLTHIRINVENFNFYLESNSTWNNIYFIGLNNLSRNSVHYSGMWTALKAHSHVLTKGPSGDLFNLNNIQICFKFRLRNLTGTIRYIPYGVCGLLPFRLGLAIPIWYHFVCISLASQLKCMETNLFFAAWYANWVGFKLDQSTDLVHW